MSTQTVSPIKHQHTRKYGVANLRRFVECDTDLLTPALKGVRTKSERGQCAFYGYLPMEFPRHYVAFRNMLDAELTTVHDVDFTMDADGFIDVIPAVGPIPSNLQNPILARTNPDEGFVVGNLKWVNETRFRPDSARRALEIANSRR